MCSARPLRDIGSNICSSGIRITRKIYLRALAFSFWFVFLAYDSLVRTIFDTRNQRCRANSDKIVERFDSIRFLRRLNLHRATDYGYDGHSYWDHDGSTYNSFDHDKKKCNMDDQWVDGCLTYHSCLTFLQRNICLSEGRISRYKNWHVDTGRSRRG